VLILQKDAKCDGIEVATDLYHAACSLMRHQSDKDCWQNLQNAAARWEAERQGANNDRIISNSSCDEDETLIENCLEVLRSDKQHAGIAILQRRLRLGYSRAARIMDELERRGNVGPIRSLEPREVF